MQRQLVERELTDEGPGAGRPRRGGRSATVNLAESPLTWLHARGHITDRQFDAGERLRADWARAQLAPSITMRWDAVRIKGAGGAGREGAGLAGAQRQTGAGHRA